MKIWSNKGHAEKNKVIFMGISPAIKMVIGGDDEKNTDDGDDEDDYRVTMSRCSWRSG